MSEWRKARRRWPLGAYHLRFLCRAKRRNSLKTFEIDLVVEVNNCTDNLPTTAYFGVPKTDKYSLKYSFFERKFKYL